MITCLFTCGSCNVVDSPVKVRAREDGEDIDDYMAVVQEAVGVQHMLLSPMCYAKKMKYLKIPLAGENRRIGEQTDAVPPLGDPGDTSDKVDGSPE